jgi:NADPH:quinone reductase-like Zn-dependent oxidoreductase
MRAIVRTGYGSPDALRLDEVDKPELTDDGVLVKVRAASVNRADWHLVTGTPLVARVMTGLFSPKENRVGVDFAGTVEAVGKDITEFQPGDEVFGGSTGAFADYVSVRVGVVKKPAHLTFEEAAAVPVAALTALQGLRDRGQLQSGQKVLVNGASGGVGTFAVQVAKALGAEVTGVCHTRNVDLVGSLGADHVVDYTHKDFTRSGQRYDLLFDIAGSKSWSACKRVLARDATLIVVGGPKGSRLMGPVSHLIKTRLASLPSSQTVKNFLARVKKEDLEALRDLIEQRKLTSALDRTYDLTETADALRYMGEGHARAKIIITP